MKYIIVILILIAINSNAQYKYAAGIRFDRNAGVTFKNNNKKGISFEAMLHSFGNGAKFTLLAEKHEKALKSNQWRWYYGAGGHMGVASHYKEKHFVDPIAQIGIDGIIGIEHTFNEIPLNLSLDWKPEFNLLNYSGLHIYNAGISLRFAIK